MFINLLHIVYFYYETKILGCKIRRIQSNSSKEKKGAIDQITFWEDHLKSVAEKGRDESNILQNALEYSSTEFTLYPAFSTKKHFNDIEMALQRIELKTFGVCVITGRLIDKKRLLAVPTTTKSLSDGKKAS